jgi:hypothetical protein
MHAVKRPGIIIVGVLLALFIALLWAVVIWVPADGTVQVWNGDNGTLRVPARGPAFIPRWSGSRLDSTARIAEIRTTTSDGARIGVTVTLEPPIGVWQLQKATTPEEGLRRAVADRARQFVGEVPLACLAAGAPPAVNCPADPPADLSRELALELGVPEGAMRIALEPEADSVRTGLLGAIADKLSIPRRKVLVLGLDGLDWHLVLPWIQAGKMPNLKRLMDAGTWGEMDSIVPMLSPLIWTTMATGLEADIHGVLDFVEMNPDTGQASPITGRSRKVPAIWNVASALGLQTDVVGWWATWPAERINGTMVSDRLYYTLQQGIPKETFHQDPPDLIFPSERTSEFTAIRDRAVTETDWRALRYFMDVPEAVFDNAVAADHGMEDPVDGMRRIISATRTYLGSGLALADDQPDLLMVYLEGTDTIGHLLAPYLPPPTLEIDPGAAAVYAAAVPKYFEIVDRWIGRYLEACPLDEYVVIVVSDHGFKWGEERPRGLSGTAGPTAPLWHAKDAVFVIAGPDVVRRGRVETRASVYDIAPTLAALLGIPADAAWRPGLLPGCPPAEAEPVEWMALVPPASYSQGGGGAAPVDPEFIAKLKALGYLGEDGVSAAAVTPLPNAGAGSQKQPTPIPVAVTPTPMPATVSRGQINNLAVIKINEKKYDEAERLLRQVIEKNPNYGAPHYNLRRIYMETEDYDRADEELWIAIDMGFRDPERTLDRAAADYETMEMPERADAMLTRAIEHFPDHEPFYVHLMVVKVRGDRCAEALPIGAVAAERFPESGPVHAFYGLAAACVGESSLARREIALSLEINPEQPVLRQTLQQLQGAVEQ